MKKEDVRDWLEYFVVFSFFGWIYESIWCSIIEQNVGFVNRGVLLGPWLPIYGTGILIIFWFLKKFNIKNGLAIFVVATLISAGVELIGSYIMEAITGSFAWDYSEMFGNFQGRIAVKPDMMFGFLTLIAYFGVMPLMEKWHKVNKKFRCFADAVLIVAWSCDIARFILVTAGVYPKA